jgi:hypothetical protein
VERAIASAVAHGAVVTAAMNDGSRDPNLNPWASRSPDAVRVAAVDDAGRLLPSTNRGIWVDIGARGSATSARPRVAGAPPSSSLRSWKPTGLRYARPTRLRCRPGARPRLALCSTSTAPCARRRRRCRRTGSSSRGRAGQRDEGGSGAEIQCGKFCTDRLDTEWW